LWAFRKKLDRLGHFWTGYDSVEHLKLQFRDQLDKLLEEDRLLTRAARKATGAARKATGAARKEAC
jgi:hypothetical protein